MSDLYRERADKSNDLDICIRELRKTGTKFAEAERAYSLKKAETALRLRDEGMPVGMIEMTVKGDKEVAELKFKLRIAEITYDANKEAVQAIKLQLRLIENQLQREYADGGRGTI